MLVSNMGFKNKNVTAPSLKLREFIARAEAELLPKKKRGVESATYDDLRNLVLDGFDAPEGTDARKVLADWATERNIQLPEGE